MAAPKGNQYYLIREKDGRDRDYTPEQLVEKANEYFNWCIENPLYEEVIQKRKISRDQEVIEKIPTKKMRAMTVAGLAVFLGMAEKTFYDYAKDQEYSNVISRIRTVMDSQMFDGAAANLLNPNIIARRLGLTEKMNVQVDKPNYPEWMDEGES